MGKFSVLKFVQHSDGFGIWRILVSCIANENELCFIWFNVQCSCCYALCFIGAIVCVSALLWEYLCICVYIEIVSVGRSKTMVQFAKNITVANGAKKRKETKHKIVFAKMYCKSQFI